MIDWREFVRSRAVAAGYPCPELFIRQMEVESASFDEDVIYCRRFSPAGARGIAQFMPETAAQFGIDPCDPDQAIGAALVYMRSGLAQYRSYALALAAYNAGGGNVARYGGVPPFAETHRYLTAILGAGWPEPACFTGPPSGSPAEPSMAVAVLLGAAVAVAGAAIAWAASQRGA